MIRTRFRHVLMVTAAVGLLGALTVAQGQGGADQLLQAARTKAAVEGKLDEAIKLYADVATKFKADRPTVVRALIEMADCYDKLGQAKARSSTSRSSASTATRRRRRPRRGRGWRRLAARRRRPVPASES